ncbi:MAG: hypothetical protein IT289_02345 [Oligoflexia bacterium]|nr:hypothetical protein [Oligoflexia bacterium]
MKFLTLLSITCLLVGSVSAHAAQDAGELLFDDPEIVQTQEPITHEAWTQLHRQQSPKKKHEVSG